MAMRITIDKDVVIPMRDGTRLRANVYRPEGDEPVPAILVRTPYGKDLFLVNGMSIDPIPAVERGFAVVYQDVRGRYASDGDLDMFEEAEDGHDSVEWVAGQTWCNGSVGMAGLSYLGLVQWLAASQRPQGLKTIIPTNIGHPPYLDGIVSFVGGAFKTGYLLWLITQFFGPETARRRALEGATDAEEILRVLRAGDDLKAIAAFRPLADVPVLRENPVADWYDDVLRNDGAGGDDAESLRGHHASVQIPVLSVGGWFDYFLKGQLENFVGMQQDGGSEAARTQQRLLIGPWDHLMNSTSAEYDFGFAASTLGSDFTGYQLAHFEHYLKEGGERSAPGPRVRIFVMGENVWRDEDSWPLERAAHQPWYLRAGAGGGRLSPEPPAADERPDHYLYDPADPAPTLGGPVGLPGLAQGINVGPYDQRPNEARPDVLTYTSEVLEEPLEVTGPLTAQLHAATSASDTDWIVRLCDVHPDGASRILAEGVVRARHRNGPAGPSPVEPGAVERYEVDLVATSNVFLPGHRIRVDITSSSFPYLEPNPNTGNPLGQDGPEDVRPALQSVVHDAARPSHIVLPVVPRLAPPGRATPTRRAPEWCAARRSELARQDEASAEKLWAGTVVIHPRPVRIITVAWRVPSPLRAAARGCRGASGSFGPACTSMPCQRAGPSIP
jgi:putative CocE/NonD family hydrolase